VRIAYINLERAAFMTEAVEGHDDDVLLPCFESAPKAHWPKRVVIEDLFIDKSADNSVKRMKSLGYREAGRNRINVFLMLE